MCGSISRISPDAGFTAGPHSAVNADASFLFAGTWNPVCIKCSAHRLFKIGVQLDKKTLHSHQLRQWNRIDSYRNPDGDRNTRKSIKNVRIKEETI